MMFIPKSKDGSYAPLDLDIVGFIGCDGVGTTTHADHTVEFLESHGYDIQKEWMRFDHRISLPVLALSRVLGMNKEHNSPDDHTVWGHTLEESQLLTDLFKQSMVIDQHIMTRSKFNNLSKETDILVCDRFILDGLIDLVISTKKFNYLKGTVAQQFWDLVPSQAVLIGLDCGINTIASRRPDATRDPYLELRTRAYRQLFEDEKIITIDTAQPLESAKQSVEEILRSEYEITQ